MRSVHPLDDGVQMPSGMETSRGTPKRASAGQGNLAAISSM
jgi:hypothetical protein